MNNDLTSILFPVRKVQTTKILPKGFITHSENSHVILADIENEKRVLNFCSNRYALVPNSIAIIPAIEKIKSAGIKHTMNVTHRDNSKFYVDINFMEHAHSIGESKDLIFPRVKITHSYDGSLKYGFTFGWFRLVCSNGLVIPVKEKEAQNINVIGKHTNLIHQNIELFFEKLTFFLNNASLIKLNFQTLSERSISNPADRIEEVLRATQFIKKDKKTDRDEALIEYVERIVNLEAEKLSYSNVNDWLIYNGINHLINNEDINTKHPEVRDLTDRKVFDYILG
jgi:hypothetical protein